MTESEKSTTRRVVTDGEKRLEFNRRNSLTKYICHSSIQSGMIYEINVSSYLQRFLGPPVTEI
jgi:hypothetical protein